MENVTNKSFKAKVVSATAVVGLLVIGMGSAQAMGFKNITLNDTDGDGVISADEVRAARDIKRQEMVTQYDTDGDGELSRAERKAMKQAMKAEMVAAYDQNGDGELSRLERRAARDARAQAIDLQLDVNGDGELSEAEQAGFDEVAKERRKGRRGHGRKHSDSNGEGRQGRGTNESE